MSISGHMIDVNGNIPVLPSGIPRLMHGLADDGIDFKKMTRLLEEFPSIAGRLISVANSAWAAPVTPVVSLLDACTRIGLSVVRGLAIALSVTSPFDTRRCPQFDSARFWSSALLTADGAEMFARYAPQDCDAQVFRTAGLLHHLGLLWLADRYPLETGQSLAIYAETPGASLTQMLRDITGTDYCEIGARLAQVWDLPKPLVDAMRFHRDPSYSGEHRSLVRAVGDSVEIISRLYPRLETSDDTVANCTQGIRQEHCQKVFERLQQRFDVTMEMASTVFGA